MSTRLQSYRIDPGQSLGGEVRHHVLLATSAALYGLCLAMFVNVHPLF